MNRLLGTRRGVLAAALALAGGRAAPAATVAPEAATLLAPGPEDGAAARFANTAARGLARGLVQAAAVRVRLLGGPDGITAANRFATATPAEHGTALLLLPGRAALALLVGDERARFEPRRWPAVAGSLQGAVVAGRGVLGRTVRLASSGPAAPDTAALLALDLIGVTAAPVILPPRTTPEAALRAGLVDAVVLSGAAPAARAEELGLTPWFSLDDAGGARDPTLPDVPALGELLADPEHPEMLAACRAAGAALRVQGLVVLPALTGADSVALWRAAAQRWVEAEKATAAEARCVAADAAADVLATLCPPPPVALAYREWLLRRLGWQAG